MQKEIWKDVPNYEGYYQVSDLGRVKSLDRIIKHDNSFSRRYPGSILRQAVYLGYSCVSFSKDNKKKQKRVHKLVAEVFLNFTNKGSRFVVVDHINNVSTDNRLCNLQIITQRENASKDQKGGTSKYIGVSWNITKSKWTSCIYLNGKTVHLGTFKNEIDASNAYQNKLKQINNK